MKLIKDALSWVGIIVFWYVVYSVVHETWHTATTPYPQLVAEFKTERMTRFERECEALIKFGAPMEECVSAKIRDFVERNESACAKDDGQHAYDCRLADSAFSGEAR